VIKAFLLYSNKIQIIDLTQLSFQTESIVEEKEEQEQEPTNEEETFTLFVKNLNFNTTDKDLENVREK
jgi:RNA recognition motif-containing protein